MSLCIINQILLTNQRWQTRKVERGSDIYAIGDSGERRVVKDAVAHEISLLRTYISELAKQFTTINSEKVNTIRVQGATSRRHESEFVEEAKYVDHQLAGFQAQGQGNQGRNY